MSERDSGQQLSELVHSLVDSPLLRGFSLSERQDIVQDVVGQLYAKHNDGVAPAVLRTRIHNRAVDLIRRKCRERRALLRLQEKFRSATSSRNNPPSDAAIANEFRAALAQAMISNLSPRERIAIYQRFYASKNLSQIADDLGVSLGTAHALIASALAKLHRSLRGFGDVAGDAFRSSSKRR